MTSATLLPTQQKAERSGTTSQKLVRSARQFKSTRTRTSALRELPEQPGAETGSQNVRSTLAMTRQRSADRASTSFNGHRVDGMLRWVGRVTDVYEGGFTASLTSDEAKPTDFYADFPSDVIADYEDIDLDDVVYVAVRTVRSANGRLSQTHAVRLQRLGVLPQSVLDAAREEGRSMALEWAALAGE